MKRPGFIEGVLVAAVASASGAALYTVFDLLFNMAISARLTVAMVCTAYVVYLLWRSPRITGRMTAVLVWGITVFATWFINPTFVLYLLVHIAVVCLIRATLFYSGVLSAGIDLLLSGMAVVAAIWAYINTGSVFIALWCLFLVQAMFGFIPAKWDRPEKHTRKVHEPEDPFARAQQNAEAALRKLSNQY